MCLGPMLPYIIFLKKWIGCKNRTLFKKRYIEKKYDKKNGLKDFVVRKLGKLNAVDFAKAA